MPIQKRVMKKKTPSTPFLIKKTALYAVYAERTDSLDLHSRSWFCYVYILRTHLPVYDQRTF